MKLKTIGLALVATAFMAGQALAQAGTMQPIPNPPEKAMKGHMKGHMKHHKMMHHAAKKDADAAQDKAEAKPAMPAKEAKPAMPAKK